MKSQFFIVTEGAITDGRNWDDYNIDQFITELDSYMVWYCEDRIKSTLGGVSPLKYRRRLGLAV